MRNDKRYIKGLGIEDIQSEIELLGFPAFHGKQIYQWMYRHGVMNFSDMSNLPKNLLNILTNKMELSTLSIHDVQISKKEDTKKIIFKTYDEKYIESVSMIDDNRHTICISSQIGCNVDCSFCATGLMGFKRNLSTGEIIDQAILIREMHDMPITNVVFMGMGEPMLNYKSVMDTCAILHNPIGFDLGNSRITISTSGILPKIKKYIEEEVPYKLAISLNAVSDEVRDELIPINKKWNIENLLNTLNDYPSNNRKMLMLEYVLIADINDSKEDALRLSEIANFLKCKLNIIPFNEIGIQYKRPSEQKLDEFLKVLHKHREHYNILVRWSKGIDIDAACGQLATKQ